MYKAYIEPDLQTAHIKIVNKFNPFTGFQNPTYILKVRAQNSSLCPILCDGIVINCIIYYSLQGK